MLKAFGALLDAIERGRGALDAETRRRNLWSALDTPMMRQFIKVKAQYPDAIIFYRMGDFYEMFLDDAELVAPILDIALTSRDKGKKDVVPMCGVPVHAADAHIKRLAELGHRIAICEQVEDPEPEAGGKRLVRREVVEVVTPGLVGDPEGLDARQVVAVAAIAIDATADAFGLAVLDASTADFRATEVTGSPSAFPLDGKGVPLPDTLVQELSRVAPRELLVPESSFEAWQAELQDRLDDVALTALEEKGYEVEAERADWPGDFMGRPDPASRAAIAIANYLTENQPFAAENPPRLRRYEIAETVVLDASTRRHLELHENSEDRGRAGTLVAELDQSACALGARRVAHWLRYPLLSTDEIERRQDAVEWLVDRDRVRGELREAMAGYGTSSACCRSRPGRARCRGISDSCVARFRHCRTSSPPSLRRPRRRGRPAVESASSEPGGPAPLEAPLPLPELSALLEQALIDDPPTIAKGSRGANETGYIREGYRSDLDALRESATKGREWIAGLEAEEREWSGIATLKVRFHPVHGYSLEVGKAHLAKVPDDYERKQTLASVERFTTESLREVESKVMGANERAAKLEREIFEAVRLEVCAASEAIREARTRSRRSTRSPPWRKSRERSAGSVRWSMKARRSTSSAVGIRSWRRCSAARVPTDSCRTTPGSIPAGQQILLLTGPNMSGKSTYLRQVALIVLMAQMGSSCPPSRLGSASSTASSRGWDVGSPREGRIDVHGRDARDRGHPPTGIAPSLVILDEIGRGTSTFDGLSIAWAVAEYLHDTRGVEARTLFATHYHELVALSETKPRIRNAHFEVREWNEEVIFLRRLVEGGANRSYGIQVARLAGLPTGVVELARQILHDLEGALPGGRPKQVEAGGDGQLSLQLAPTRPPQDDADRGARSCAARGGSEHDDAAGCVDVAREEPGSVARGRGAGALGRRDVSRLGRRARGAGCSRSACLVPVLLGIERPPGLSDVSEIRTWSYADYHPRGPGARRRPRSSCTRAGSSAAPSARRPSAFISTSPTSGWGGDSKRASR